MTNSLIHSRCCECWGRLRQPPGLRQKFISSRRHLPSTPIPGPVSQLANVPWYPRHLIPPMMHSRDCLSSRPFTTRLLPKKSPPLLVTISTSSSRFRTPFLYDGGSPESLDFSYPWFLYQMLSPFRSIALHMACLSPPDLS